jgi:hypothetical protein
MSDRLSNRPWTTAMRGQMKAQGALGGDLVMATDPGCDDPKHRRQIQSLMLEVMVGGLKSGTIEMVCGCKLKMAWL